MSDFKESDMYEPVAKLLIENGFDVKGEVNNCDITAQKDGEIIIVELKKSFTMKLLYQITERQSYAANVYACIPRSKKGQKSSEYKSMIRLLKRLDAGLITVAMDSPLKIAEIVLEPSGIRKISNSKKAQRLKKEISQRTENLNKGGVSKTKIVTAYREKSIDLLCLCNIKGSLCKKDMTDFDYGEKAYSILYRNYYKWFEKEGKGKLSYTVSKKGKEALDDIQYSRLVEFYTKKAERLLDDLNNKDSI